MKPIDGEKLLDDLRRYKHEVISVDGLEGLISLMPSVQPEQCEDAVSRKDAIRWLKTECNPYGKPTLDFESGKKVIEHLERMSAVTPKRKNGKWIKHLEWQADGECGYECDQCGMGSDVDYDFCMRCGADMRGEKDE